MVGEHHDDPSHGISIWFFIGALLTVYGIIVLVASLLPASGAEAHVVLANLHAGIWWGAMMLVLGLVYTIKFAPKKTSSPSARAAARIPRPQSAAPDATAAATARCVYSSWS